MTLYSLERVGQDDSKLYNFGGAMIRYEWIKTGNVEVYKWAKARHTC